MKKSLIAALLAATCLSAVATEYYVVVPLPNRTSATNINVTLNSGVLPGAIVGKPYPGFDFKTVLQVTGDPAFNPSRVTWRVVGGALPPGLTLDAVGVLSGSPSAGGTSTFQLQASYQTKSGQQSYQIITQAITVSLAKANPPHAVAGQAYRYDLKPYVSVTGDNGYTGSGVTWAVVSSTLPSGLQLLQDGTIGGTPTMVGTGSLTAQANYGVASGQQSYQVSVEACVPTFQVSGPMATPITGYYQLGTTNVGSTSAPLVVPMTNAGNCTGTFTVPAFTGNNALDFAATTTCVNIAPGAACEADVVLKPSQEGARYGAIAVAGLTLKFTGTGQGTPTFQVTGNPATSQSFGTVNVGSSSSALVFSVTNSGTGTGSLTVPAFAGANPGDFKSTSTCADVSPGAGCQVNVTFQPIGTGARSASLAIAGITYTFNGTGYAAPKTVALTSGSSYVVPAGMTSATVWAVGAGGGGAGTPSVDSSAGGAGGAGGTVWQTFTVQAGQTISYSLGVGGTGGVGNQNGQNGGYTQVTVGSTTLTAFGGSGGLYNNYATAPGGSWVGGSGGVQGGAGRGVSGDTGGGGGGGIGNALATPLSGAAYPGQNGATAGYPNGLDSALIAAGQSLGSAGAGSVQGTGLTANVNNGGAATGFGSGGGGAGYFGGNGGNGAFGGGGGGAAGYMATQKGGAGGGGFVVIQLK